MFEIGVQKTNSATTAANLRASQRNSAVLRGCGSQSTSYDNCSASSTTTKIVASEARLLSLSSSTVTKPRIVPKFTSFKLHCTDTRQQNNTKIKSKSVAVPPVPIIPRFGLAAKPSGSAKRKEKSKNVGKQKVSCISSRKEPEHENFPNSEVRCLPLQGTVAGEHKSLSQISGLCTIVSNRNVSGKFNEPAQLQMPEQRSGVKDLQLESFPSEDTRKTPDKPDLSSLARLSVAAVLEEGNMVSSSAWKLTEL